MTTSVYTLPVIDEDGDITGIKGAVIVPSYEKILVDGDMCSIGQCLRDEQLRGYGADETSRIWYRAVGKSTNGRIEEYLRHNVIIYPKAPIWGIVWERVR